MAKETKILKLYQVTRPEDDDKAFNIQTMLNDNWDKIDKAFEKASTAEAEEGTNTEKIMTPKTTKDAILKLAPQLEYKDVTNLSATPSGVISWNLPQATDQTRTSITVSRANKDISNMDIWSIIGDSSITKMEADKDGTKYTLPSLVNNTQYWVKVFVRYVIGGKGYYSNGVTVTFTYSQPVVVTEFFNAGNEYSAITGGWVEGYMSENSATSKSNGNLYLTTQYISGSAISTFVTNNKINMSNLKTLKISWTKLTGLDTDCYSNFGASNGKTDINFNAGYTAKIGKFQTSTSSCDVSKLSGDYYLKILNQATSVQNTQLIVHRVWGEGFDTSLKPNVNNLTSTQSGAVSWTLPTDNAPYRTGIEVFKATKDISNFDHATCVADGAVTKTTLGKDVTNTTLSGLVASTQYWVKVFVKYTVDGVDSYSTGVSTSFTYVPPVVITEFYNAGNEFTVVTGGWRQGAMAGANSITTKGANEMLCKAVSDSAFGKATLVTTNQVDVTNIRKLKFEMQAQNYGYGGTSRLALSTSPQGDQFTVYVDVDSTKPRAVYEVDVSNITGLKYVAIMASAQAQPTTQSLSVYRVWGES